MLHAINLWSLLASFPQCSSTHFLEPNTIFEATMGLKALRLFAIDMLKGLCGDGRVDVPLTEDDCFDENGEIDDEIFEEYLMQEDNEDEVKKKLLLALTNMVGSIGRKRKRDALEDFNNESARARKLGLRARGGILTL
jgi:hypothetical protein